LSRNLISPILLMYLLIFNMFTGKQSQLVIQPTAMEMQLVSSISSLFLRTSQ
jgi:hypothetical protein